MTDVEHLQWIYERLVWVHGERDGYDYMRRFKETIARQRVEIAPPPPQPPENEDVHEYDVPWLRRLFGAFKGGKEKRGE